MPKPMTQKEKEEMAERQYAYLRQKAENKVSPNTFYEKTDRKDAVTALVSIAERENIPELKTCADALRYLYEIKPSQVIDEEKETKKKLAELYGLNDVLAQKKDGVSIYDRILHDSKTPVNAESLDVMIKVLNEYTDGNLEVPSIAVDKTKTMTAAQWVEDRRRMINAEGFDGGNTKFMEKMCSEIMAARLLSDSVRGKKSTLQKQITGEALLGTAKRLRHDAAFRDFMGRIANDPKQQEKALRAATAGHGGELDDMFRSFVKNLPAGELTTGDPFLGRYMPTAGRCKSRRRRTGTTRKPR